MAPPSAVFDAALQVFTFPLLLIEFAYLIHYREYPMYMLFTAVRAIFTVVLYNYGLKPVGNIPVTLQVFALPLLIIDFANAIRYREYTTYMLITIVRQLFIVITYYCLNKLMTSHAALNIGPVGNTGVSDIFLGLIGAIVIYQSYELWVAARRAAGGWRRDEIQGVEGEVSRRRERCRHKPTHDAVMA